MSYSGGGILDAPSLVYIYKAIEQRAFPAVRIYYQNLDWKEGVVKGWGNKGKASKRQMQTNAFIQIRVLSTPNCGPAPPNKVGLTSE